MSDDVIFEFITIGSYVKVTAIHTGSMVEVAIVGAPSAGESALKAAALRKLKYVLNKKAAPK